GEASEFERMTTHAQVTFDDFGLYTPELEKLGIGRNERIFRRDCLEIDLRIGGLPLTLYIVHFKAMSPPQNGLDGRESSMPVRIAEAAAVRRIINDRFGQHAEGRRWAICGDLNDYRERVVITGDPYRGHHFRVAREAQSSLNVLTEGGFCENVVERRPELDRWTLYH